MKKNTMLKTLTLILILGLYSTCNAGDWEFNIMGINPSHFKGRDWKITLVGALSSIVVHEAGHLLYAEMNGGGHYNFNERVVIMEDYYEKSHSEQQMFHRAGFLGQLIVGSTLTAIPKTRHSDFTLGFNSFTTVHIALYTITGGKNENTSDISNLDNGGLEGTVYSLGAGTLSYINLKNN